MTDAANKLARKHTMPKATHQRDWRTDSVWQTEESICHILWIAWTCIVKAAKIKHKAETLF